MANEDVGHLLRTRAQSMETAFVETWDIEIDMAYRASGDNGLRPIIEVGRSLFSLTDMKTVLIERNTEAIQGTLARFSEVAFSSRRIGMDVVRSVRAGSWVPFHEISISPAQIPVKNPHHSICVPLYCFAKVKSVLCLISGNSHRPRVL